MTSPGATAIDPELPAALSMSGVLRITLMRRLWYAQTISVFGDFLALFAVISVLTFRLHANAQQITGVQIAYFLPIILGVSPWKVRCGCAPGIVIDFSASG